MPLARRLPQAWSATMLKRFCLGLLMLALLALATLPAQAARGGSLSDTYSADELVHTGSRFFGSVAQGLATLVEKSVSEYGLPNGYILGEEGSGALVVGARYGQGTMYTRNRGEFSVYWQGPSIGFDFGGDGSKVMMLVYNLPDVSNLSALSGRCRLGLCRRRPRHDRAQDGQCRRCADPLRHRRADRHQRRLSPLHPRRDLEPFLISDPGIGRYR
jgi:hypothetical protein